jgi:hypothetical protein
MHSPRLAKGTLLGLAIFTLALSAQSALPVSPVFLNLIGALLAMAAVVPGEETSSMKPLPLLRVSESQTHLITADGKPFMWIGDTAWELFHRLSREEAGHYLKRRSEQGFNVVQAVVLAENDGLRTPNAYGDVPLKDLDPTKPNEAYFEHVDWIVDEAERRGLYVGMLPTWGDKLYSLQPGAGPIVFNPENALVFGRFLGHRYRSKAIIWILGGDRNVATPEVLEIWRAMARGLREGDGGAHLISYHPRGGGSSSASLHSEPWLDFNMYQSGHGERPFPVYRYAANDAKLQPRKPFVEGEPAYEDIPVAFWEFFDWSSPQRVPAGVLDDRGLISDRTYFPKGFFNDYDVRVHAYWNILTGACGYTYGNNAVWQMYRPGQDIAIPCLYDWRDSLERPGAQKMRHVRALFEPRLSRLVPDQSLVSGPNPEGADHIRAAGSSDRSFALAYFPQGKPAEIVLGKTAGDEVSVRWHDPRTGFLTPPEHRTNSGTALFSPPDQGPERDWVLVLEQIHP